MSRRFKIFLFGLPIALIAVATSAFLITRANNRSRLTGIEANAQTRSVGKTRNLSLQPEAFKLSRRLGKRFTSGRTVSTLVGTVASGATQRSISIVRRQTATGENLEIGLAGEVGTLTWSDAEGARASGLVPDDGQRQLIERLALDGPDEFVLAQLRGARYHTIGRNVRSDSGGNEDYSGPLWDIVRIDEPASDETRRPLSSWRLYYINVKTGLIDKVVAEVRGETIEAHLLHWVDQGSEKVPSRIVWKLGDQTIQEFQLSFFTNSQLQ